MGSGNQIFRKAVPNEILFGLLESICLKTNKYYLIDMNSYKKMLFNGYNNKFFETIRPYYHDSKLYYLTRKTTYNSFTNIIRQICKNNNIMFASQIKYCESKYVIEFFIFF
jgi:hypothetical protein